MSLSLVCGNFNICGSRNAHNPDPESNKSYGAWAILYKKLAEAEAQIENGEPLLDAEDVFTKLGEKYGRK